jgi:two-component system, chemotaxis family, CheB/CheR fusion protein
MTVQEPTSVSPFPTASSEAEPQKLSFPVVGVGASAGGLDAIRQLLENLPSNPGLCLLVVVHLSSEVESQMAAILAQSTGLTVEQASDGTGLRSNHVYIIPPGTVMTLADSRIVLKPRTSRGLSMPIDHLFRSLAEERKGRAVGVLLSGEGTDGTLGFQAIKAEGGITFAQDEQSASHKNMPRSAASNGHADYVLPPARIAKELLRLTRPPYADGRGVVAEPPVPNGSDAVNQIIGLVRSALDVDFSHYKRNTVTRRIQRRMALRGVDKVENYLEFVRGDTSELRSLYEDFLIRVTQFFRDPEAFEALKTTLFPQLLQNRVPSRSLRVWVAGCASGEEVYSLAIALLEFLATQINPPPIKVLATDLSELALERARTGIYVDNIELDVSPERLRRFFVRSDGCYRISKPVRELCVFSRHNMANDPPFSHLDLISCRNVLIYMDSALQRRVLPILHYALKPGGGLLLGSSESVGPFTDLFATLDGRHRIFCKKDAAPAQTPGFSPYVIQEGAVRHSGREPGGPIWSALEVQREADRLVLARYAPVGVVIDESCTVLQFRGRTAAYLEPAPGMASLDLFRMIRSGLLAELRAAINQARTENSTIVKDGLRLADTGGTQRVRLEVIPFKVAPSEARFFLVLFQDLSATEEVLPKPPPVAVPSSDTEQQVVTLQQELGALRQYLQSVIEERESTNEELKSANEEILSANEELQSTNEELQTAKEETQSANEELNTLNEELRHRNTELDRVNNDLLNLLSGVNIPIVMVGRDLHIRRFTPLAEKVFNFIPTDLGRPISDIKPRLQLDDLSQLLMGVIDTLTPYEGEVRDQEGHWYSLRVRPYITLDNKIDGASIVLLDIDSVKRSLERLQHEPPKPPDAQ